MKRGIHWSESDLDAVRKKVHAGISSQPKRPKYGNQSVRVKGLYFASKLEAQRYGELQQLQAVGEVAWFIRRPGFYLGGGVRYFADFLVVWNRPLAAHLGPMHAVALGSTQGVTVEDTKGYETATFKLKMKLMAEKYPNVKVKLLRAAS
jgi:hypothetical protein